MTGRRCAGIRVSIAMITAVAVAAPMAHGRASHDNALDVLATSSYYRATDDGTLTAETVFDLLVKRYKQLDTYADEVRVVYRTTDTDAPNDVDEVEMTMDCTADADELTVRTSGGSIWRSLGVSVPFKSPRGAKAARQRYNFFLAPHMVLKFSERPLTEWQHADDAPLEATAVTSVTIEDRALVQLDLAERSDDADEPSDREPTVSLFINPDSMLVERVDRTQVLDDGRTQTTTLDITPTDHSDIAPPQPTSAPTLGPSFPNDLVRDDDDALIDPIVTPDEDLHQDVIDDVTPPAERDPSMQPPY
ncbi:MAG: hypothetical protein AAF432_14390 [Planctomycetota bacterium]